MKKGLSTLFQQLFGSKPRKDATVSNADAAVLNKLRPAGKTQTFCLAPSTNMLFAQDGSVRVCCHNMEHIGRYPDNTIDEIWNGAAVKSARAALQNYNLKGGCEVCQNMVDLQAFEDLPSLHFDTLPQKKDRPVMMEFLLSNTCNLECIMCQGEYSSLIRKNREKLPPIKSPYDKEFLNQLRPYLLTLTEARFSGSGEAFAIDMYYEIWETLVKENPSCKIVIQSNGTYLNGRIKDLLERGNFQIGISLDSLKKENLEAIRLNASFDRVIENIEYFSQYSIRHGRRFLISTCVMRNNRDELPAFVEFATAKNAVTLFHQVHSPQHLSLETLSHNELAAIYNSLNSVSFNLSGKIAERNIRHYRYFMRVIENWMHQAVQQQSNNVQTQLTLAEYEAKLDTLLIELEGTYNRESLQTFKYKFEKVVSVYNTEQDKAMLYQHSLNLPATTLVEAILKYPEEYLLTEAANLFKV